MGDKRPRIIYLTLTNLLRQRVIQVLIFSILLLGLNLYLINI